MSIDVCTYNAGNAKAEKVAADFQRLAKSYPVIGCQEVADRHKILNATGMQVFTGGGNGRGKVAVLSSLPVVATGYVPCTPRTFVGAWGAGPKTIDAKGIRWVRVVTSSGEVTVGATHLVPSVQRPAKGPIARAGLARRRALYRRHVAAIVKWVKSVDGPLDIVGDFNATPAFPLLQPLHDAGLTLSTAPSHGDRAIDHHWSRGLVPLAVDALDGFSSDHKPVAASFDSEEKPVPDPEPWPKAFDRVTFRGKPMDNKTMYGLMVAERRLGYELTVTQGCYNKGGVPASAGTHDLGGVVDLAPWDQENKVRVLRDLGWAAWYRSPSEGPWPAHIHAVMIDHGNLSAGAAAQVESYRAGRNGLANNVADPNPYRPNPIPVFDYTGAVRDERIRGRITGLQAQIKRLRDRISANRARITYKGAAK